MSLPIFRLFYLSVHIPLSLSLSLYLSISLSLSLCIQLFTTHPSICMHKISLCLYRSSVFFIYLSTSLSLSSLSLSLSLSLSIYLHLHLSFDPLMCLSLSLPIYLSNHLYVYLSLYSMSSHLSSYIMCLFSFYNQCMCNIFLFILYQHLYLSIYLSVHPSNYIAYLISFSSPPPPCVCLPLTFDLPVVWT